MSYSYTPLQPLDGTSAASLHAQQESNMVLGAFAANHSGLASEVHTDWTLGEEASENACDSCRLHNTQCIRSHVSEKCHFCREKNLECAGPGAARHSKSFVTVDQSLFDSGPVDGEYEVGQSVTVMNDAQEWDRTAHIVKRVIYKPVAIVLDNDNNTPIPIDDVRPYPERWPIDTASNGESRDLSIDPSLMAAKVEEQ